MPDPLEITALIQEGRYEEVRALLDAAEVDGSMEADAIRRWRHWLREYHRADRARAGLIDHEYAAAKRAYHQRHTLVEAGIGGGLMLAAFFVAGVLSLLLLTSATWVITGPLFVAMLIVGFLGWLSAARLVAPQNGLMVGMLIPFVLTMMALNQGVFFLYFPERVPTLPLLLTFAMYLPGLLLAGWYGGSWIAHRLTDPLDPDLRYAKRKPTGLDDDR